MLVDRNELEPSYLGTSEVLAEHVEVADSEASKDLLITTPEAYRLDDS
jgi:hypothetical protein